MTNSQSGVSCSVWCWGVALLGGILTAALLMILGDWRFIQGVFMGLLVFVIAGVLLSWILCRPMSDASGSSGSGAVGATGAAAAAGAGAAAASGSGSAAAQGSGSDTASSGAAAESASSSNGTQAASDATASASAAAASDAATASEAAASSGGTAAASAVAAADSSPIKPSTDLPGQNELAARKGEWRYDNGDEGGSSGGGDTSATSAQSSGGASDDGDEAVSNLPDAASEAPTGAAASTPDYDGDGKLEGENEGSKPEMLSGPRDGGADNLKEIKGIGPKLEKLVNSMGVYHFDQIANWSADEVAWVNANLSGFKGRVTRDNWIEQAKVLAAGGETEFSKKVEKGGVYD